MTTTEPMARPHPTGDESKPPVDGDETDIERLAPLRGAGVSVDTRAAIRAVVGVCLAVLVVLTAVLFVAGFRKNSQQSSLASRGVPVTVTVTNCLAEMGGSGSNLAGYACTGTYVVDGHLYRESIPGNTLHGTGTTVQGVTVPGNPSLLSTPGIVQSQRASWTVFIVPTLLLLVLIASVALLLVRRRHADSGPWPAR